MMERYAVLAARVRQELASLEGLSVVQSNVYSFEFEPERIDYLVQRLRPAFEQLRVELLAFADFTDSLAQE